MITHRRTKRARTRGFTLIELMVSLAAGMIAVVTLYSLSSGASRHFQEQQTVSQTQTALRLAMEQLRADIERAGFGGTPASRAEQRCSAPSREIQAVEFLDNADTALLPFANVNGVEADGLRLTGNFSTSGSYLAVSTTADGASIILQQSWQAFRRDFGIEGDPTAPFDATTFESVFSAGKILHVESAQGYHFFPIVSSAVASTKRVSLTSNLPVSTACLPGLADNALISPLSRIEYRVVNPAAAGLTALVSANPNATGLGINAPVLVRRELPIDSDTPIPGTTRVVLEYVADLHIEIIADTATTATSAPVLTRLDGAQATALASSAATAEPERIRSVIVELAARTSHVDPRFTFGAGRGSRATPLTRFAITSTAATAPAAHVRSVSTEIFLPNVATRNLR